MENVRKSKFNIFYKIMAFILSLIIIAFISLLIFYFVATAGLNLNTKTLALAGNGNVTVYANNGEEIDAKWSSINSKIKLNELKDYTINAFISMEDKKFYRHNGIDILRIGGAILNNIKSGKAKQGGSTISQQLVKNSQLSQEKTYTRKLKEIKLTRQLEKKFSKDEILEMYLNTIYFGNGCYGIEDASLFYFNKHAKDLSLNESALLVATINAPSVYNPITNYDKTIDRKNLVLKSMLEDNKISQEEYNKNISEAIKIYENNLSNSYSEAVINEACEILGVTENQLINLELKIYTYQDVNLQKQAEKQINTGNYNPKQNGAIPSISSMIIDNNKFAVIAFASNGNGELFKRRQPGSAIKPILVYAPAIENNIISPATKILDEPINFNGYSPTNASKTYSGYVSIRTALKKSLNIPAVKVLSYTGIEKSKEFAEKLGITFSENDNNYAIALGGFTNGVTMLELANSYSAFANEGRFATAKFIRQIKNAKNEVIYNHNPQPKQVMQDSTAYLMNDMLIGVSKHGTASRLKNFNFEIGAKTGTVGEKGSSKNTDAWNVAYTTEHTFLTHIGTNLKVSSLDSSVNGSTYPTLFNRDIINHTYRTHNPNNFRQPDSAVYAQIDAISYEDNLVELANESLDDRYKITELFKKDNLPETSERIIIKQPNLMVYMFENLAPKLKFRTQFNVNFSIMRDDGGGFNNIKEINGNGQEFEFLDNSAKKGNVYTYKVVAYKNNDLTNVSSNTIKIYYK